MCVCVCFVFLAFSLSVIRVAAAALCCADVATLGWLEKKLRRRCAEVVLDTQYPHPFEHGIPQWNEMLFAYVFHRESLIYKYLIIHNIKDNEYLTVEYAFAVCFFALVTHIRYLFFFSRPFCPRFLLFSCFPVCIMLLLFLLSLTVAFVIYLLFCCY